MSAHSPSADTYDLPTREDVQELRQAIESLRDHVQIVWQAIDEVREVIGQTMGHDAAEFWNVEPPQDLPLGRYRPFAGYDPVDEWQAENEEAPVEPPPVLLTSDDGADGGLPEEMIEGVHSAVAVRLRESHAEGVDSLADTHRHNGYDAPSGPATAGPTQQRSLWEAAAEAATQQEQPTTETPQKEAEPRSTEPVVEPAIAGEQGPPRYFAPLPGSELVALMQRHKVTISQLAKRTGITQTRIREAREKGLTEPNVVRDWLQAILGRDPGPVSVRPAAGAYTLDDWIAFRHRFSDGEIDAAGIRAEFQRMKAGKTHFIEQLQKSKSADQLRLMAMQLGHYDARRNTKPQNAESIYRSQLRALTLSDSVSYQPMQETYEEAIERIVMTITDETIAEQREKHRQEREATEKALTNPETYQEYSQFVGRKGTDALSDEQLATWDRLNADISRAGRKEKQKDTVERFRSAEVENVEFRIAEGFHEREQVPLWIVQMTSRVERETFNELKIKARQLGGWWSSFKKDAAGFQFRSKDSAEKFAGLTDGDADRSEELLARKLRKMDSASERLNAVAESLEEKAAEVLAADDQKLKNTARRADMAASMRAQAFRDQADAKTLRSIAAALAAGGATYLDGVWNGAQVQTLTTVLRQARRLRIEKLLKEEGIERARHRWSQRYDELEAEPLGEAEARYAVFPKPCLYRGHLVQAFAQLGNTPGVKKATAKMQKLVGSAPKDQDYVEFVNDYQVELLEDFLGRAKAAGCRVWWFDHVLESYKRLRSAHIYDNHELRAALRELVPHLSTAAADDPVTRAEDELRGKDLPGFFPTPRPLIERMLDDAEIEPTHRVLEPSCGKGDIVDAIRRRCPEANIAAIERNLTLQGVLTAKGYSDIVCYGDFLKHRGEYDRIIMNPPFEQGQDIEHLRHAYDLLAPGGCVVAIASEGPFFRSDAKSTAFREWLSTLDGEYDASLPDDTFKGVDAFRQTGVKTRYVILRKP